MAIDRLSTTDTIVGGDKIPVGSQSNGDDRKISVSTLLAFMQANLTFASETGFDTQYAAPSATGFSVQITDSSDNTHLILTPSAGYAAGTIVLPISTNLVNNQEILVNCTQAVTTLTIDGNGATAVTGEPTTLAANGYFRLKYDSQTDSWFRVG